MPTMTVYISRQERFEAAEAYKDRLNARQIEYLKENDRDFQLVIDEKHRAYLLEIEDEG